MKTPWLVFLLITSCGFIACTGPRNIYSSSPFVSPFPMEESNTAIEANYFSHTIQTNKVDSSFSDRDNCFGLNVSHMLKERTLLFGFVDVKKERNLFANSYNLDTTSYSYNAGFDSSFVIGKRYTAGAGIQFFSDYKNTSTNLSFGFHHFDMNESGLLRRAPYQRFYKINQLSLSLQQNFQFKSKDRFKLAWIMRLTVLKTFKSNTNYLASEKFKAGLQDKRVNAFLGHIGLYADYQLIKKKPLYLNGQLFNDLNMWKKAFARDELGRTYIKGTGVAFGIKYIFNR